jgi:hypothetical protein
MIRKNIILISLVFIFLFCSSAFASWTVSPYSIGFGDVPVGSSKTVTLVIKNTGTTDINIQNIYSSIPEVTTNPSTGPLTVAAGGSLVVTVIFKPIERGNYSGELVIVSDDPSQPSVTVPFTGISSYASGISVSPTSIGFGDVPVGSSKTVTLVIKNTGTTDINIQNIYSSIPEVTVNPTSGSLRSGESLIVTVTFTPTARGNYYGELVIVSDDSSQPSVTIPLAGISSYANGIDVSPNSINFGTVSVGQSATNYVRVANNGTSDLNVSVSVTSGTPFTVSKNSFTLKPGQYETLTVTFAPTEKGSFSGVLAIISDDKNTPKVTVNLFGETPPEFPLSYYPRALNFGTMPLNETHEKILKIFNTSSKLVKVDISIQNLNGNAFSFPSSYPTSLTLSPGETRRIPVKFSPTEKVYYTALISLVTDTGVAKISVTGDGGYYIGNLDPSTPPPSSGGGGGGGCSISGTPKDISLAGNTVLMIIPVVAIAMRKLYRKFRK